MRLASVKGRTVESILADKQTRTRFLTGQFAKRYGSFKMLSENEGYASVEISTTVLTYYQRHDPIQMTIRMLGPTRGTTTVRTLGAITTGDQRRSLAERIKPAAPRPIASKISPTTA